MPGRQALAWVVLTKPATQQPRSCWKDLGCSFASFCSGWPAGNFRLCPSMLFLYVLVFVSTVGVRAKLFPWRMRVCKPTPATCVSNGSSNKLSALTRPTLLTCQDDRARVPIACYQWLLLKFACLAPAGNWQPWPLRRQKLGANVFFTLWFLTTSKNSWGFTECLIFFPMTMVPLKQHVFPA